MVFQDMDAISITTMERAVLPTEMVQESVVASVIAVIMAMPKMVVRGGKAVQMLTPRLTVERLGVNAFDQKPPSPSPRPMLALRLYQF